jgi:hypothetical protein
LNVRRAEDLPLAAAERMNWKTFGTFLTCLRYYRTENNLSDKPGNILNTDVSGIQVNNKPDSIIIENRSEVFVS